MENVIAVVFKNESDGYQMITELRNAPKTDQATILQMGLVKCDESGVKLCDSYDAISGSAAATTIGGLMGAFIGILGGPIGILLMGATGAMAGSMVDVGGATASAAMLEIVADKLSAGDVALVVQAQEEDEAYLDEKFSKFPVEIARFDAADVAEELEEAVLLQKEMTRQARYQLRQTRKADMKASLKAKRQEREAELEKNFEEYKANLDL